MKISIIDFCNKFNACDDFREWALENCKNMSEVWRKSKHDYFIFVATQDGVLSNRDLRLFACWCARKIWHLLKDERLRNSVIVSEKYAIGEATKKELNAAWYVSLSAITDCAGYAAWSTTFYSSVDAAKQTSSASIAVWYHAENSVRNSVMDAQDRKLRKMVKNPFED